MKRYFWSSIFCTATLFAHAAPALASDFDRLLRDGFCNNCNIDGGSLSGMTIEFRSIENSKIKNVDFSGATVVFRSLRNVAFESVSFDGADFRIIHGQDFSITNASLRNAVISFRTIARARFEHVDLTGTNLDAQQANSLQLFEGQSRNAVLNFRQLFEANLANWNSDGSTINITGDRVNFHDATCKACSLQFDALDIRPGAAHSSLTFVATHLGDAYLNSGFKAQFGFQSGTILNGASVNGRACRGHSVDGCQ